MVESALKFETVLKEVPVILIDKNNVEMPHILRELNGEERAKYSDSFKLNVEVIDGKAAIVSGEGFKLPSNLDFLALCLYDNDGVLVPMDILKKFPGTTITGLSKKGHELSGMDAEALEVAKNVLKANDTTGIK